MTQPAELPITGTEGELPLLAGVDGAESWSARQVRDSLASLVSRDLLGPWQGDHEELPFGTTPSERYIVGVLAPANLPLTRETTDGDDADNDSGGEASSEIAAAAAAGSLMPASMGMSFVLERATDEVGVDVEWGRYDVGPSQTGQVTDAGVARQVWRREHVVAHVVIDVAMHGQTVLRQEYPHVLLRWQSRRRGAVRIVELALVNGQEDIEERRDRMRLFQSRLAVTARDGTSSIFLAHAGHAGVSSTGDYDPEHESLDLLYRDCSEFAIGRNVAVVAERRDSEQRAWRLCTAWVPSHDVAQTRAPEQIEGLDPTFLDMAQLADADREAATAGLQPLVNAYEAWLDDQERRVAADPGVAPYARAARSNLKEGRDAAHRIAAGLELLRRDNRAWDAWRFTNRAMALQRLHTEVATIRIADPSISLEEASRRPEARGRRSWRPFQLAFVLLNLPALTDPGHRERAYAAAEDGPGLVDLLFFPTGGGKTEAYLGLVAYSVAIRRLQGVIGSGDQARDGKAGVAAIMRYTLRLLTSQQYQRAATLVCAAEAIRREAAVVAEHGGNVNPWGVEPFRIGLWVGAHVTPNSYDTAKEDIERLRGRYANQPSGNLIQLARCPWCALEISPARDVECDDARRRTVVYCSDPDGECPFSRRRSADFGEGIPVVTVDEEIFRLCPSLVIGTVDKFAQLPLRGYTGLLFGRVSSHCARHGYRHADLEHWTKCRSSHPRRDNWPATQPEECVQLRPPDLIIQDELHLISGALGTMVALYETAVDRLASWTLDGKGVRPKVVASTATVRRAKQQVHGVFAREVAIFPPPVIDAGDTFFSRQVPVDSTDPGRRYLGICAHGQRLKQVEIRVAQILLAGAQWLFDGHGDAADPYMTLVDYFSSTRELAGMRRLVDDDIATRLRQDRRGLANRRHLELRELTSRISSREIGPALDALARPFRTDIDTTAARQSRGANRREGRRDELPFHAVGEEPVDIVLATSMLQVGVDVPRLGLMVVTGQPKNAAEYIQATSRIGRDPARPGLVVTIYNWARPRDLTHYETFHQFHSTAYARVEALSVTPFAARALDRGLVGVMVAAIRHAREQLESETGAQLVSAGDGQVRSAIQSIAERAGEVLDVTTADEVQRRCSELLDLWDRKRRGLESGVLTYSDRRSGNPLLDTRTTTWDTWSVPWSLRDVEPEINLIIETAAPEVSSRPAWRFRAEPVEDPEGEEELDASPVDEMGITATPRPGGDAT